MATSGSVDSGGYQGRVLRFAWSTSSTSGNTRTISYSITAVGGSSSYYYHHDNIVSINGTTVYEGGTSDYVQTGTILASGTFSINQNQVNTLTVDMHGGIYVFSDNIDTTQTWTLDSLITAPTITYFNVASKTVNSITCGFNCSPADTYYYKLSTEQNWTRGSSGAITLGSFTISNLTPNTSYTIDFIARRWINESADTYVDSTASIPGKTYQIATFTSVPNVNIGSSQTITWSNPSGASLSLALCKTGATSVTTSTTIYNAGTVTGTSKTYRADTSTIYALAGINNSYRARWILTTTQNGQSYKSYGDFDFYVTNSNPIFNNFTYADINSTTTNLTKDSSVLVAGYSKNQITISTANKAVAQNGATMDSYKVVQGTQTETAPYSSSSSVVFPTNGFLVDSNIINVYAIDNRTNTSDPVTKELEIGTKYIEYEDVELSRASISRSNGGAGETTTLTFNGTYWNNKFSTKSTAVTNNVTATYKYKEASASSWTTGITTLTLTKSSGNYSFSGNIRGDISTGFNIAKSYNVQVTVSDSLSSATYTLTLGAGSPAIAIYSNKVAIGQKYNTSTGGALQVNGDTKVSGNITATGFTGDLSGNATTSTSTDKLNVTQLYNSSTGTYSSVTLSQSAANFTYLEIFFKDIDSMVNSVKIYSPNGKSARLSIVQPRRISIICLCSTNRN